MKRLTIGILAHVDAGKTTLSEALLYKCGIIKKVGRVDNKDAYLDNNEIERMRGITIFSKQAIMDYEDMVITLLDTPGHVDFSTEMERCLDVLDYAILVISATSGVESHTVTLWKLLQEYKIPTFVFVNKMDQYDLDKKDIIEGINKSLADGFVDFSNPGSYEFYEDIATHDEEIMTSFFDNSIVEESDIKNLISRRIIFPCYFGSALKLDGIEEFLSGFNKYSNESLYNDKFSARVFKITRDEQGQRMTHLKVTGGVIKVRDVITNADDISVSEDDDKSLVWEEKISQIRQYSGDKFEVKSEATKGEICAVTGLTRTYAGQILGDDSSVTSKIIEPVLTYVINIISGEDNLAVLPKLKLLQEEDPSLHIVWNKQLDEIQIQVMGEVQIEVLKKIIKDRFNIDVEFDTGNIVYKESIRNTVEGVGHFEPLRHYSEVHLLMEPLEPGSGIIVGSRCDDEVLSRNWQKSIISHIKEKEHMGVLIGVPITDVRITLVSGRSHPKHTEGGDFRQATYRAIRQGLKQADSVILEPYYDFRLVIPEECVGRAMTDIDRMKGTFALEETSNNIAVITGMAPVVNIRDYQKEVLSYTKGKGNIFCTLRGYDVCHNEQEVLDKYSYNSENDLDNPTGSIFCKGGAGFYVTWENVKDYMNVPSYFDDIPKEIEDVQYVTSNYSEEFIGEDEIEAILSKTYRSNKGKDEFEIRRKYKSKNRDSIVVDSHPRSTTFIPKDELLLVDAYNVIHCWEDLKELFLQNMDAGRGKLLDILSNFRSIVSYDIIVVFDGTKASGHDTEEFDYQNIHVVYTKEGETADQYIEKYTYNNSKKFNIKVATSDNLEQMTVRSVGGFIISSRELKIIVDEANDRLREEYKL